MPKLFWVALPLLLLAAFVAVQAMRHRLPSRRALNVWSSVLLLAYVLATAGLGIFWVANQQLPVFDWHYLFGYATVLLVAIHLTFNFRAVWRYFAGPAPTVDAAQAGGGRRGALAALGVLATAGAAFALGLYRGRSELRGETQGSAGSAVAPAASSSVVERFHAFTSHSRSGVLRSPGLAWIDAPAPFKRYASAARVALPAPGAAPGGPPGVATLGTVLWHTSGVTETRGGLQLRASPSSGALFSTELYVAARSLEGLPAGLWHYDAERHALQRLPGSAADDAALGAHGDPAAAGAAAVVVATALFARTGHKYRDRTYRYVLADLGHALENLRQSAAAAGLTATLIGAFDEARAAATLALDEREEGVLALVALAPADQTRERATHPGAPRPAALAPVFAAPAPSAGAPSDVTAAMHLATSLRAGTTTAPVAAAPLGGPPASATKIVLPPAPAVPLDVLAVIAARRSIRRFAPEPISLETLAAVLAGAARDAQPALSAAVRVSVLALNVAALPAAAYRYESASHGLVRHGGPVVDRAAARAAALDQDVIGDAAAVFVLSLDRALIAGDALGAARGYRHAFLEAGLLGERIYLQAGARRLGACGVGAFYDDEIAALAGIDPQREWVVHLAALGLPAA